MKDIVRKLRVSFFCTVLGISILPAQDWYDPQGIVRNQLMTLIHIHYGSDFHEVDYSILDSLISHSSAENENIRDPYNTLKGCVLFSTYKNDGQNEPDAFIVGMMRNGKIIWDNAPGTHADLGGEISYAQDINKDGEVDLVISESDRQLSLMSRSGPPLYYLYVLSWNGERGKFINKFRKDGKSAIIAGDFFELVDKRGNGIKEIEASFPQIEYLDLSEYKTDDSSHIIYTWNGKQYGVWPKHVIGHPR